ncbi:MAG: WG repeat-containing protein [Peptococcaceae bacterium]|nr:WG repeat-containing protein [Peptococcaceae bacterium]
MLRRRIVFMKALILIITFVGTGMLTGCSKPAVSSLPKEPMKIKITAGPEQRAITYEILPNKWNKTVFDRADYRVVLSLKLHKGEVNQCYVAYKDGLWQLYDYKGNKLSQDKWEGIYKTNTPMGNEVNGLVAVKKNGVWGCVDQQGKVVITPNWDAISLNYYEEVEPYLRVEKNGKYGYLTYDGQTVLKPEYDMAVMDVLNGTLDVIFVRRGDEWGAVKVINNKAGEVDWTQKPRDEIQIGFMEQRYASQAQTVHDLLDPYEGKATTSVIHFFYEYYRKNGLELLYMPDFHDKNPDWDLLTKFAYTLSYDLRSTKQGEARSFLTTEEFDGIVKKYFEGITYTHRSSNWLTFSEGKYTPKGWSDHGFRCYYLSGIERTKDGNGGYRFKAKLIGYQFWEDDFMEGSNFLSPNMKALKNKAQEPQYQGKTSREILPELMIGDPTQIFSPAVEHTIEFTIENPRGDIYLKYLSASRKELNN